MKSPSVFPACLLCAALLSPASATSQVPSQESPEDARRPFFLGGIQLNEDDHERWAASLIQAGMNAVEVTAYAHQGAWNTADLWYEEEEPSVLAEIQATRRNGLQVVLILRVALDHNDPANRFLWHGLVYPETEPQLAAWFQRYGDFVVQWARVAETQGVEVLGLASEMNSLLATLPVEDIPELPAYYLDDAKQQELRELVAEHLHLFSEDDRVAMGAGDFTSLDDFLVERNQFERRWARVYTFNEMGGGETSADEVTAERQIAAINHRRRVLEGHWRRLIERVRAVYSGRLTVAANFDNYHEVSFWDDLDLIGINAYFPLRETLETPLSEAALTDAWRGVFADVEAFRREHELKQEVVFTELWLHPSRAASASRPGARRVLCRCGPGRRRRRGAAVVGAADRAGRAGAGGERALRGLAARRLAAGRRALLEAFVARRARPLRAVHALSGSRLGRPVASGLHSVRRTRQAVRSASRGSAVTVRRRAP